MSDQIKGGDLIFQAGNAGPGGRGGDLHVGPGTYKAGDVTQQKQIISVNELANFLVPIIQAHPKLEEDKKKKLIDQLREGIKTITDIASLAILLGKIFGQF